MGPELVKDWAQRFLRAVDCDGLDISGAPFDKGFDNVRDWIDARLGKQPASKLEFEECRMEWTGQHAEGKCESNGHTSRFIPDETFDPPSIGAECKLRFPGGSYRVLVLRSNGDEIEIARAPHRHDRREHKRITSSAIAVVRLGSRESRINIGDISEGGIGFDSPFIVEAGQHLDLLLRIEGNKELAFECEGLVVNCRKPMKDRRMDCWLGVQFTEIPPDMRDAIRKLVTDEEPSGE